MSASLEHAPALPFELELLSEAKNYQGWLVDTVQPFLGKRILEVGSGIGNLSVNLPLGELLVTSEFDPELRPTLQRNLEDRFGTDRCPPVLPLDLSVDFAPELAKFDFDTIVSFNVLEHLSEDFAVLERFAQVLSISAARGPKRIVTIVPAHEWAYGSLDKIFGHFRRYNARRFKEWSDSSDYPGELTCRHFNLLGLGPWVVMNRIMRTKNLSPTGMKTFERICPYVRGIDDFLHTRLKIPLGQSILAVWTLSETRVQ
jgi:hypothetical protein